MSSTLEQAVGRVEELLLHPLQDPQVRQSVLCSYVPFRWILKHISLIN